MKSGDTSVKSTWDRGYDNLNGKKGRHAEKDRTVHVVNGMNPDDMDRWQ